MVDKIPGKIIAAVESTAVYKWGQEKKEFIESKQDEYMDRLQSYVPAELLGKVPPECLSRRISISLPDLRLSKVEKQRLSELFDRISDQGVSQIFDWF